MSSFIKPYAATPTQPQYGVSDQSTAPSGSGWSNFPMTGPSLMDQAANSQYFGPGTGLMAPRIPSNISPWSLLGMGTGYVPIQDIMSMQPTEIGRGVFDPAITFTPGYGSTSLPPGIPGVPSMNEYMANVGMNASYPPLADLLAMGNQYYLQDRPDPGPINPTPDQHIGFLKQFANYFKGLDPRVIGPAAAALAASVLHPEVAQGLYMNDVAMKEQQAGRMDLARLRGSMQDQVAKDKLDWQANKIREGRYDKQMLDASRLGIKLARAYDDDSYLTNQDAITRANKGMMEKKDQHIQHMEDMERERLALESRMADLRTRLADSKLDPNARVKLQLALAKINVNAYRVKAYISQKAKLEAIAGEDAMFDFANALPGLGDQESAAQQTLDDTNAQLTSAEDILDALEEGGEGVKTSRDKEEPPHLAPVTAPERPSTGSSGEW